MYDYKFTVGNQILKPVKKVLNSKNSSNKLSDLVTAIYELGTASK